MKRDCDTISRNVNIKHGAWMELDVIEAVRHWIKASSNSRQRGGMGNRSMDLMLMVDVRDQDRNELNASQYFEQTDCQACKCAVFRFLVFRSNRTAARRSHTHIHIRHTESNCAANCSTTNSISNIDCSDYVHLIVVVGRPDTFQSV